MIEESEAFRHWRDLVRYARPEDANRSGVEHLLAQIADGWVFQPGEVDVAAEMAGFEQFGLAAPLRRLWPQLTDLVAGSAALAQRMAQLSDRVMIIELDLDGFAASTRPFPDDSYLVQIDSGLFLTIFEVVQYFVAVSMPAPGVPPGQAERESAVLLELLLAEFQLLRRNASSKSLRPTPAQGEAVGELTQAAHVFVLTHEVAHLLMRHTRDHEGQRQREETESDILAFQILAGAYAAASTISRPQAYGRLLGARLTLTCIDLFERATFVTLGRSHPPAADRWDVVREAAERLYGASIPDGVEQVWRPMDSLLRCGTTAALPLDEVRATLESMATGRRYIGTPVDVPSAINLIRLSRLMSAPSPSAAAAAEGAALAGEARTAMAGSDAITWSRLLELQVHRRPEETAEAAASAVAVAARMLRER